MRPLLISLAVVVLSGCYGKSNLEQTTDSLPASAADAGCGDACVGGEMSRFIRLTHAQWENTVSSLLMLEGGTGLLSTLEGDINAGTFDTHVGGLKVGAVLWSDYQRAAEALALMATPDLETLAKLLPADLPSEDPDRAIRFVEHFGRRAFRRPLTDAEVSTYVVLFAQGPDLTATTDPLLSGARIVIQAMLQSPWFLYRVELSDTLDAHGRIVLGDYEIATRLSYALWNTAPDEALLKAAEAGELRTAEGVTTHAKRMLEAPQARAMLARFHHQLFDLDQLERVQRDPSIYPGITDAFGRSLVEETELFIDDVVFSRGEGLHSLLLSTHTFANDELASVYGLTGEFGDDFQRVELDPAERSGLLTRAGFMAAYSHEPNSDPIRRGVFVNLRVFCSALPEPPDVIPPLPEGGGTTMRERITNHTGTGTCGEGCHSVYINPVGFAFEHYDGLGRYRTEDNGAPVNAADSFTFEDGQTITYTDALSFSSEVARAAQTHRCYAKHWVEYFFGRDAVETDEPLIQRLMQASLEEAPVRDLLLTLVTSPTFLTRAPEGI